MLLRRVLCGTRCWYRRILKRDLTTTSTNHHINTTSSLSNTNTPSSDITLSRSSLSPSQSSSNLELSSATLSSFSTRREIETPYQIYRRALCLTKERSTSIYSPPAGFYEDNNHALSPTDPRFSHLFPSLAIRVYHPSPLAVPFFQDQTLPTKPAKRLRYEHTLSHWYQLHCHLFHVTGSDRWTYAAINKAMLFSPDLIYDDQFLSEWTERRKKALHTRREKTLSILRNLYAEEFGDVAGKRAHRASIELQRLEQLSSLLDEQRSLQNRELVVRESSSGISATEQSQILISINEQMNQVKHGVDEMLVSLGYDPKAPKDTLLFADPSFLQEKAHGLLTIVQEFESWCALTLKKAFDEQSSWIEPPESKRRLRKAHNYRLHTPNVTRIYKRKIPASPKVERLNSGKGKGNGCPLWLEYLEEAKAEIQARKENPDLQNTSPSFAVILSQYFDVNSTRFMMEWWRHRQSLRETHRRAKEEDIVMTSRMFRLRSLQRHWHFHRQELKFWFDVVNQEIKRNAENSASVSSAIESWQSSLAGHRPNIRQILQLLKNCLPYLSIREPIPRLSTFDEFCPPNPESIEHGLFSFEQTPFSLPYSEQHSDSLNEVSIKFFHDPQSGHKFGIGLVNSRVDLVSQIARAILASFTKHSSGTQSETQISSSNWLELRPDESSDGIEAEATTLKPSHDWSGTSAETLEQLNKYSISPLLLPDFVQEGWLMIDMGELMILSCSDISMMSTWISNDKQLMNKVDEDQFLRLCETTPPALNQCNVLVKSTRSTQLALSTDN